MPQTLIKEPVFVVFGCMFEQRTSLVCVCVCVCTDRSMHCDVHIPQTSVCFVGCVWTDTAELTLASNDEFEHHIEPSDGEHVFPDD